MRMNLVVLGRRVKTVVQSDFYRFDTPNFTQIFLFYKSLVLVTTRLAVIMSVIVPQNTPDQIAKHIFHVLLREESQINVSYISP